MVPLAALSIVAHTSKPQGAGAIMGINWFEGGRRIVLLIVALIAIGGAAGVIASSSDDRVVIETSRPDQPFAWTLKRCRYPDFAKEWPQPAEFKPGDPRTVIACFRANQNGKILVGLGTPYHAARPVKDVSKAERIAHQRPVEADYYSDAVESYAVGRMNHFRFTPGQWQAIRQGQWKISVLRFFERVNETLPWVIGLILGTVAISFVVGWLVRGFAGIPSGRDFRSDNATSTMGKATSTLDWVWIPMVLWVVAGGLGWIVANAIGATTGPVGKAAGTLVRVSVRFCSRWHSWAPLALVAMGYSY